MVRVMDEAAIEIKAASRAATLRDLTRMFWSAVYLHRRGRLSPHIEPTLWHVTWNSTGALHKRASDALEEIIRD